MNFICVSIDSNIIYNIKVSSTSVEYVRKITLHQQINGSGK